MKQLINLLVVIFLAGYNCNSQLQAQLWVVVNSTLGSVSDIDALGNNFYTISNLGEFGYSNDNMQTWTTQNIKAVATIDNPIFTAIHFYDENHGIVAARNQQTGHQLLETLDGGQNWSVKSVNYETGCNTTFSPIDFNRVNDSSVILSAYNSAEYKITTDKAENWRCDSPFDRPEVLQNKVIRSDNEWIFSGDDGLYNTLDGGLTWTNFFNVEFAHYHQGGNNELYGLTWSFDEADRIPVLYLSFDDFVSNFAIPLDEFQNAYIDVFVYDDDGNIFIVKSKDIYHSKDGGQSFRMIQTLSNQPVKMQRINDEWFLFGRGLWVLDPSLSNTENQSVTKHDIIYPNPTTGIVHIENQSFESFKLMNLNGEIVKSGQVQKNQIDFNSEPSGSYILQLESKESAVYERIVKM